MMAEADWLSDLITKAEDAYRQGGGDAPVTVTARDLLDIFNELDLAARAARIMDVCGRPSGWIAERIEDATRRMNQWPASRLVGSALATPSTAPAEASSASA